MAVDRIHSLSGGESSVNGRGKVIKHFFDLTKPREGNPLDNFQERLKIFNEITGSNVTIQEIIRASNDYSSSMDPNARLECEIVKEGYYYNKSS